MRWSDEAPPRYSLHYEWPSRLQMATARAYALIADSLEDAKLEAAILYACADPEASPHAYRIVRGARTVVYRYPESGAQARAAN
ncbi:hypothetical protein [Phenylobacterium sp.]|uniref:hypothetical protein n=1 Tax=Phenylobacterium sp. TaxID=1871053 RepID=UPI002D064ECA|nr:hypothetical protein [Phenylobacterium sp.]HLZ76357.1 hypothetical protein [Phenylobacterium sp.]